MKTMKHQCKTNKLQRVTQFKVCLVIQIESKMLTLSFKINFKKACIQLHQLNLVIHCLNYNKEHHQYN